MFIKGFTIWDYYHKSLRWLCSLLNNVGSLMKSKRQFHTASCTYTWISWILRRLHPKQIQIITSSALHTPRGERFSILTVVRRYNQIERGIHSRIVLLLPSWRLTGAIAPTVFQSCTASALIITLSATALSQATPLNSSQHESLGTTLYTAWPSLNQSTAEIISINSDYFDHQWSIDSISGSAHTQ